MTMFTLKQLLDLAEAEGRIRYAEGFTAGLEAGEERQAAEWAELMAATLETQTHDAVRAVIAELADAPVSRTFTALGIDPVTADAETLRQCAEFWRYREAERVRSHLRAEVAA